MTNVIYGVPLNGAYGVRTYSIIRETPKTYIIDDGLQKTIRKSTMCTRWERYFTYKSEAENFLMKHFACEKPKSSGIDLEHIHRELSLIYVEFDSAERLRTKRLLEYVESLLI